MFSYLRPHRRTPSNPTSPLPSPLPDQAHSWENSLHQPDDHSHHNASRTQDGNFLQTRPSNTSPPAASLTPLSKVPSDSFDQLTGYRYEDTRQEDAPMWLGQGDTRVPSSMAPEQVQRIQKPRPGSAGENGNIRLAGIQYLQQQPGINTSQTYKARAGGEFITAADLLLNTGKKQTGARIPTPPSTTSQSTSANDTAQHRPGKTRLNLLNPMSLLARRRHAQAATYPSPAPPPLSLSQPKLPDGYDPRIRGTRVHDFSAPRQKRHVSHNDVQAVEDANAAHARYQRSQGAQAGDPGFKVPDEKSPSRWSGGNHMPMFTEDFDEEQYPAAGPNVRKANDFTDLSIPRPPYARGATQPITQSEKSASNNVLQTHLAHGTRGPRTSSLAAQAPILPTADSEYTSEMFASPLENFEKAETPHEPLRSSSSRRTRPRNASQASAKDYLPKHMLSTSSRFSFDMIGAASQEKLLEDRHRQKALEKKGSSPEPPDSYDNELEDEFDYDNMYDDDGLEERIPGVNADAEDDEDDGFVNDDQNLAGFSFHSLGASVSNSPLSPYSPGMVSTPRDANGEVIGFAVTRESPALQMRRTPQSAGFPRSPAELKYTTGSEQNGDATDYQGLGLQAIKESQASDKFQNINAPPDAASVIPSSSKLNIDDDDDLYFDDGVIDPPIEGETAEFDESIFDNDDTDEYGRPLRPLSSLPTLYSPPFVKPDAIASIQELNGTDGGQHVAQLPQNLESPISPKSQHALAPHPSVSERMKSIDQSLQPSTNLTHDSLSAYQSALAAAAYAAAANGRFRRDSSPTVYFDERDEEPGMTTDNNHLNSDLSTRQPLSPGYEDDFDYEDALEDDSIIAEANAEALANDSDGFYGQEFGFYSASGAGEAQYGGIFGFRGPNATAAQPGRIVSREPNLTPITERSEYSNRNSIMSLPLSAISHGMGPGSLSSPGLAQLAGMMGDFNDNDLSLDALLKLRRGAWGGSQASLRSSNGNGSPMSAVGEDSPAAHSPLVQNSSFSHARHFSGLSIGSDFNASPAESAPESPTMTTSMSMPSRQAPALPVPPPISASTGSASSSGLPVPPPSLVSSLNSRPLSPTMKFSSAAVGLVIPSQSENDKDGRPSSGSGSKGSTGIGIGMGGVTPFGITSGRKGAHRHTASSDSISYMKEDDPVVGERWVLERRRTAESGEVEILGREIVRGGRI